MNLSSRILVSYGRKFGTHKIRKCDQKLTLPAIGPSVKMCTTSVKDRVVVGKDVFLSCRFVSPQKSMYSSGNRVNSALREANVYSHSVKMDDYVIMCILPMLLDFPYMTFDYNDQTPCCPFYPYSRVQYGHYFFILEWTDPILWHFHLMTTEFYFSTKLPVAWTLPYGCLNYTALSGELLKWNMEFIIFLANLESYYEIRFVIFALHCSTGWNVTSCKWYHTKWNDVFSVPDP